MTCINLVIISKPGDIFSLCFIDVARFFRYHLRKSRPSAEVIISKNRLQKEAINIIFGAHIGFEPTLLKDFDCIIVNLEQLGNGGRAISPDYIHLLKEAWVIDYDITNKNAYKDDDDEHFAAISFGYAPYLSPNSRKRSPKPIAERELDVVFYGSMNETRRSTIKTLQTEGIDIKVINNVFGPERDEILDEAKLILNLPYYEKGAFEQVRAFHALSLGTPFASLQRNEAKTTSIAPHFLNSIFLIQENEILDFFSKTFKSDQFYLQCAKKSKLFENSFDILVFQEAISLIDDFQHSESNHASPPITPKKINLGSGKDYRNGYLNIDISQSKLPDVVVDLSKEMQFPITIKSDTLKYVNLKENYFELIYADNVLEHVSNLTQLVENCLRLLNVGGRLEVIVPYERSSGAWQNPTHVRAMNENSWSYYCEWSWYLGWENHNFYLESIAFLDDQKRVLKCQEGATQMHASLIKKALSLPEKSILRCMSPDFGDIPDDHYFTF